MTSSTLDRVTSIRHETTRRSGHSSGVGMTIPGDFGRQELEGTRRSPTGVAPFTPDLELATVADGDEVICVMNWVADAPTGRDLGAP
jgi:hypothetical protein